MTEKIVRPIGDNGGAIARIVPLIATATAAGSFASASAQYAHFGVPGGNKQVEIHIVWPNGRVETIEDVLPGQHLVVQRK